MQMDCNQPQTLPMGRVERGTVFRATDGRGRLATANTRQLRLRVRNEGSPSKLRLHTAGQSFSSLQTPRHSPCAGSGAPRDPAWGLQPEECLTRHPPRLCNRPSAIPEVLQPGNPLLPGIPTDGFEVATCGGVSWGGVRHLPPGPRSLASGGDAYPGPFGALNLPFPARPIANTPTAEHSVSCFYPARCKPGLDMRIWKAGEISLGLEWGWLGSLDGRPQPRC